MSNYEMNMHSEAEPSSEAQKLATKFASDRSGNSEYLGVKNIREQLAKEFQPRSERALNRFNPTLTYAIIGGVQCMIIEPQNPVVGGVILYLFGGGFVSGAPEFELPIAAFLSEQCMMRVVLPYYSQAPEYPYPTALNEVFSVYEALIRKVGSKIIVCGESSGGGLALSLQASLNAKRIPQPNGLCLFSPWIDLTEAGLASSEKIDDPTTDIAFLRTSVGAYCVENERVSASPRFGEFSRGFPITYISSGTRDILLPSLEKFAEDLEQSNVTAHLKVWPGMWHVFELYDELPEAKLALHEASSFINDVFT